MSNLWDNVQSFWRKTKPSPELDADKNIPWLRVGAILRSIPFNKLLPLFLSVPTVLFLTISGLVAWIVLFVKFITSLFSVA